MNINVLIQAGHGTMSMNTLTLLLFFYHQMESMTLDAIHRRYLDMRRDNVIRMLKVNVDKDLLCYVDGHYYLHPDARRMLQRVYSIK